MEWVEPVGSTSGVKYTSSLGNTGEDRNSSLVHGSFPESDAVWFASGDRLDVVSTKHSGVQSRHFQCPQGQEFEVTCVASIPNEPLALVGLSSNTGSGAVALYNFSTSLILNSWSISHKVTCICSMELPNANYKQILKADCFLFAVGTEEGHVMLLAIDQHFKFCEGTHQLDLNIVHYVTTDDIVQNRAYFKPPVVLVIPLNDPMYRAGRFVLESMHESQEVLSKPQEEVSVTALRYIPQSQSLCVGYNTQGAFQLFSLKTLDLDFSGFAQGCNGEQLDEILDFTFLEPEDDPRHFCYLAIVAQHTSASGLTRPYAVLYSLTYVNKDASPEGVIVYEDLQYITLRLDLDFGPLISSQSAEQASESIKLLTCKSLPSSTTNNNCTRAVSCSGLCYFAMQWSGGIYLAVFDLNQWYQAQMPSRWAFEDMSNLCPFMGFYRTDVSNSRVVHQVWIQPNTVSVFHRSSTTPSEPFFYPSALSFRLVVTSPLETATILFLGIQSLLLHNLAEAGAQVLNHPHRYYIQAVKAGLAATEGAAPNVAQMAEALLNIGLDNNCRSFLISCIKDEGANLNFVEKWAWQQVVGLKAHRENLCQVLFDHSSLEMEPQMHSQLYHVTHQFSNLAVLYNVMDKRIRALNSGVNDKLRDKCRAIYLLSLHLETVLWFLHGGLLPEADENEEESSSLPYPRRELEEFYRTRRSDIERLNSSVRANEVLLIEQLIPASVVNLWAEERGSSDLTYPPPSLYALLSAYLRPDVDDVTKHRLVQYVFMDLTSFYGRHPHYGNILQHLVTFPSTYSLKPSTIKVTQAFWHLDHKNFDDALDMLLDPLVHAMDITNAQQRAILRAFLYQDQRRHALKYTTLRHPVCPELEDIQLHLTILIANSLISDALGYIRRNKNQRNSKELMQHLLCGCQEMRKFTVLLTLPLSDEEEECVTSYLKQSRNIDLQEALLLFYIQRCKYPDAIAYSQRLNQMWPARDPVSRERFNRREMLMQTLIGALPPITSKLASIANSKPASASGAGAFPRPLSVAVMPSTTKVQYSGSNFFRTVIEQSRATWMIEQKLHQEAQTPLRSRKRKIEEAPLEELAGMEPESTPFLCNIVQSSKKNVTLGMSLSFPSPKVTNSDASCMEITQAAVEESDLTQPKQGKRPRFSLFPKALPFKVDKDVVSVLQTPPVKRSRPFNADASGGPSSSSRPSSILKDKMRRFMDFSMAGDSSRPTSAGENRRVSESESDMMEMSVVDNTAKHLRFNLPASAAASPPSDDSSLADMEIVEQTVKSPVNVSYVAEEFLSFVEEGESASVSPVPELPPPVETIPPASEALPSVTESIRPMEEAVQAAEQANQLDLSGASEGMDITRLEPVLCLPPVQLKYEALTAEPQEKNLVQPSLAEQVRQVQPAADSDSDIVCLESSSEEEVGEGSGEEEAEIEEEEEEELEEGAGEYGEEDDGQSDEEEEFNEHGEVGTTTKVVDVEYEDEERSQEEVQSKEEIAYGRQTAQEEDLDYEEEEQEPLEQEDTSDSEDAVQTVEDDEKEEDMQVKAEESSSGSEERDYPQAPTGSQSMSTSSYKQRFAVSSSSSSEDEEQPDFSRRALEKPAVTAYSPVEPDVAFEPDRPTETAPPLMLEEDEEEEAPRNEPNVSHYSQVEPDIEEESEPMDVIEEVQVRGHLIALTAEEDISDEEDEENQEEAGGSSGDEGEEENEEEDLELNLSENLSDTPASTARSRRSSTHRRRFRMSRTAESSDENEEETGGPLYREPEMSRMEDRQEDEEESGSETEGSPADRQGPSLHLTKSRFQISDSESSSGEESVAEEDEEGDTNTPAEPTDDGEQEKASAKQQAIAGKSRMQLTDSEPSSEEEEQEPEPEEMAEIPPESEGLTKESPLPTGAPTPSEPEITGPSDDARDEKMATESPVQLEESTADDQEDLRAILMRHQVVPVPILPDAMVIPMMDDNNLSVIAEERTFEQSMITSTVGHFEASSLGQLAEQEESSAEAEEEVQKESATPAEVETSEERPSSSEFKVDALDVAAVEGSAFETAEEEGEKDEEDMEVSEAPKRRGRPKSVRLSHVPLPFSSRKSIFDASAQEHSPEKVHSEPPQAAQPAETQSQEEEDAAMEPMVTTRRRGRPKSSTVKLSPKASTSEANASLLGEPAEPSDKPSTEAHSEAAEEAAESAVPKRRGRPKSAKPSTLDSTVAPDSSPDKGPSEPSQQTVDGTRVATPPRQRRSSGSVGNVSQLVTRRSSRRQAPSVSEDEQPAVPPVLRTPPKVSKRLSKGPGESSPTPSVEVSPAESNFSGISSAPGTPVRRSARIALRSTPEPTLAAPLEESLRASLGRIRRYSAGHADTSVSNTPRRRSGRLSANASRDNSPDSVTSEPPPRTETTPSRKVKSGRGMRSAQKSVNLNLFPVKEESEVLEKAVEQETDSGDSSSQEEEAATAEDEAKGGRKKRGSSKASSVTSSPSSTRYNLRRTRRPSELGMISEEDGAHHQQQAEGGSTQKRRRQDAAEEAADQAGPSSQEETGGEEAAATTDTKRPVRSKRRKKTEEEEEEASEVIHFAPSSRPPPKNLPKREPVIKSRSSRGRRSYLPPE